MTTANQPKTLDDARHLDGYYDLSGSGQQGVDLWLADKIALADVPPDAVAFLNRWHLLSNPLPEPWRAVCTDCGRSMPDDIASDVCDSCYDLAIAFEAIYAEAQA